MPQRPDRDLPPLRYSSLFAGRQLGPSLFTITPELIDSYIAVTNDANPVYFDRAAALNAGLAGPIMPPGTAGIWGRQAYVAGYRMQAGGVMAGQEYELFAPVTVASTLTLGAEVVSVTPDHPRRAVLIACSARDAQGQLIGTVGVDARWPEEDAE